MVSIFNTDIQLNMDCLLDEIKNHIQKVKNEKEIIKNKKEKKDDLLNFMNKKSYDYADLFKKANEIPELLASTSSFCNENIDQEITKFDPLNYFEKHILNELDNINDSVKYQQIVQKFKSRYIAAFDYIRILYALKYYNFEIVDIKMELSNFSNRKAPGPGGNTKTYYGVCRKTSKDGVVWLCKFAFFDENDYEEDGDAGCLHLYRLYNTYDSKYYDTYAVALNLWPNNTYDDFILELMTTNFDTAYEKHYSYFYKIKEYLQNKFTDFNFVENKSYIDKNTLRRTHEWYITATADINIHIQIYIHEMNGNIILCYKPLKSSYLYSGHYSITSSNILKLIDLNNIYMPDDDDEGSGLVACIVRYENLSMIENIYAAFECYYSIITNKFGWFQNDIYYNNISIKNWLMSNNYIGIFDRICSIIYNGNKMEMDICKKFDIDCIIDVYIDGNNYMPEKIVIHPLHLGINIKHEKNSKYINVDIKKNNKDQYEPEFSKNKSLFTISTLSYQFVSFDEMLSECIKPLLEKIIENITSNI